MKTQLTALVIAALLLTPSLSYANEGNGKGHEFKQEHLRKKLERNPNLTAEQKQQIVDQRKQQVEENKQFRQTQKKAFQDKKQAIKSDTSLTQQQKREAMKQFHKEQKTVAKQHFETQRSENKTFWGGIKSAVTGKN